MEKWSADVETNWKPPQGFFSQPARKIATGLLTMSNSQAQAMSRLNYYINRAGSNLRDQDKERLERAKKLLMRESILNLADTCSAIFS
jgi:hypothetical protein